ncbi:MAG: AAA family ATPase [Thermoplasmata archaeon]|nr:AAA family ATPase [Thermoplasmata archaeon]
MVESKASLKKEIERMQKQLEALTTKLDSLATVSEVDRVRTFVGGFDEKIGGGIPQGHVVLLAGPSGTMKSSFALNVLSRNAQEGVSSAYLALEETKGSLMKTVSELGLELEEESIVDIGEMRRVEETAKEAGDWFEIMIKFLTKKKTSIVVLDSLDAVLSFTNHNFPRDAISGFFHSLRELGLTSLIVSEAEGPAKFLHHEDRLADGVITLGYDLSNKKGTKMMIHCTKMRHTKHSMDYYHLNFDKGEFFISQIKD